MAGGGWLSRRSRLSTILLVILGLFLLGTVAVLSTAKAYFSIDKSAYILPEELGTWEEISWGSPSNSPLSWASKKYPWLHKLLHPNTSPAALAEAKAQAQAALANSDPSDGIVGPPLRDNTPRPADPNSPPEKIPRIIHQTWKDEVLPPKWQAVRQECADMHPDYEYMLWTDASSRSFIEEHYPWFLSAFDSYPYNIQRADAIRYFVLHYYGGIYMDLDIGCNRRLDPLLRFEIVLPVTRPVGVSNDLMFAAKGHPFMDQVIHNLVTFNHIYLSHYPTVMFSTGPMFVSASYGLYVDAHGPAFPSTPSQPEIGFRGVRVLPKSLYGKNAKPAEVPDAFFKHFYGSSWHAGDAGFLIFLRDHGRLLMFFGACIVVYGLCKTVLPKALYTFRRRSAHRPSNSRRRSQGRRGDPQWVGLPFQTTTTTTRHAPDNFPSKRRHGVSRSFSQTPDTRVDMDMEMSRVDAGGSGKSSHKTSSSSGHKSSASSAAVASSSRSTGAPVAVSVAAPKPQRATLPFFQLQEDEDEEDSNRPSSPSSHSSGDEPRSLLATWSAAAAATVSGAAASAGVGELSSRPGSSSGGSQSEYSGGRGGSRWRQATNGVLLLPAYALSRMGSPGAFGFGGRRGDGEGDVESDELSPSDSLSSLSSSGSGGDASRRRRSGGAGSGVVGWAAQMLPAGWRGPVPSAEERSHLQAGAGYDSDEDEGLGRRSSTSKRHTKSPSGSSGRKSTSAWLDVDPEIAGASAPPRPSPSPSVFLRPASAATGDTPYDGEVEGAAVNSRRLSIPPAAGSTGSKTPPPPPYAEKPDGGS